MTLDERSLNLHRLSRGKIAIASKVPLATREDLSLAYTPGVGAPCKAIAQNPQDAYLYTSKGNLIAVVTDGSAVLGYGNIGALAGLPVMEGKCLLFKKFAGVDAVPICLQTQDPEEIIQAVKMIAPTFGGINLEDIAAPKCFFIEDRLKAELDIPVFHDDQHGTAIVVLAGLTNALTIVSKKLSQVKIVLSGIGAAGVAIAKILLLSGATNILMVDRSGILFSGRQENMNPVKTEMALKTNPDRIPGGLSEALIGADVFIGISEGGIVTSDMVATMAREAIVFAMANPIPEIMPEEAKRAGAAVVATGRSDFPNQINNVLAFPGIFRGVLDTRSRHVTETMKLAAASALASLVPNPQPEKIIPSPLEPGVAQAVAEAVKIGYIQLT